MSPSNRLSDFWTGIVLAGSFVFFIAVSFAHREHDESWWVIGLFGLPLLIQALGVVYLYFRQPPEHDDPFKTFRNLYCGAMFLCAGSTYMLWYIYLNGRSGRTLSYMSVGFITVLLLIVVLVTFTLMTTIMPEDIPGQGSRHFLLGWLNDLKGGIARMPFWALLNFLAIFLTISFLFGFAFAFDNRTAIINDAASVAKTEQHVPQASPYPPLYKPKLPFYENSGQRDDYHSDADDITPFNLYFEQGTASLLRFDGNNPYDVAGMRDIPLSAEAIKKLELHSDNYTAMKLATERIIKLSRGGHLVHVMVIGHASDVPHGDSSPYRSNYELSEARAQMVKNEITKDIFLKHQNKWCNIQWSILPVSSDKLPDTRMDDLARISSLKDSKAAQIIVGPSSDDPSYHLIQRSSDGAPEPFTLMDYMYFSISTFTGGDSGVSPTSNYAKFLKCFANICQMFFIVGFFNALLALREERKQITLIEEAGP
ncbi:MAG: hypothetical protein ABW250_02615 [Pyrinomonadaceae bacterium]